MRQTQIAAVVLAVASVVLVGGPARAELVSWTATPIDGQDSGLPGHIEMGWMPPFPADERLDSSSTQTDETVCYEPNNYDDPNIPNALVFITNMTAYSYFDMWYVGDRATEHFCTSLSNYDDCLINGGYAFRIDKVGWNKPLLSESMAQDSVWEPNETWGFVIQDYVNVHALAPHLFNSIGVGSDSAHGAPSSGSILVPEPTVISALALGGLALIRRRRTA